MTWTMKIYVTLASLLVAFGLGLGLGWKVFRKVPTVASERPEAQVIQKDGSVVLARTTDPTAKPEMIVPKGDRVLHQGYLTVRFASGAATAQTTGSPQQAAPPLPSVPDLPTPLRIDYSLLQQPDGTDRLVFKGPSGTVVGGEDVVVSEPAQPRALNWTVGATRYIRERTYGVWAERRLAFATLGAEIKQSRAEFGSGRLSVDGAIRVGVSF